MRCSHYDHHAEVKNFCSKLKVSVTGGCSFHKLGLILKPSTPVVKADRQRLRPARGGLGIGSAKDGCWRRIG